MKEEIEKILSNSGFYVNRDQINDIQQLGYNPIATIAVLVGKSKHEVVQGLDRGWLTKELVNEAIEIDL